VSPKLPHKSTNAATLYGTTTILSYSRTSIKVDPGTLKRGLEAKLIENRLKEEQATKETEEITEQTNNTGFTNISIFSKFVRIFANRSFSQTSVTNNFWC
jgi:hypothetical protein